MTSDRTARVFYCADCGNRSRCLPMYVVVTNWRRGPTRQLRIDLELCPPCKLAWLERHLNRWSPDRRPLHEVYQRDARLTPRDFEDLATAKAWRNGGKQRRVRAASST